MTPKSSKSPSSTKRAFWNIPDSCKAYDTVVDLAPYNPLLFRVSHRNSGSFYFEGQGVVASEHYIVDTETKQKCMTKGIKELCARAAENHPVVLADKLVDHVLYSKTTRTNLVSTTFSFTWALFFAEMNSNNWKEEDVELLVIDTFAVARRAWVAHEQLSAICPEWYSNTKHRKVQSAAYSSQEVIVVDCIPESAIISRLPWSELKERLPSWFYYQDHSGISRKFIPVPNDKDIQKYVRWKNTVQGRLHQLSAVSPLRWELAARQEATAFVLAVLSFQRIAGSEAVLLNGSRALNDFEAMVQTAARSLLEWSRGFSSPSLDAEDSLEIGKLIQNARHRGAYRSTDEHLIASQPREDSLLANLYEALSNFRLGETLTNAATYLTQSKR